MRQRNPAARFGGVHTPPRPPLQAHGIDTGLTWDERTVYPPVPEPKRRRRKHKKEAI